MKKNIKLCLLIVVFSCFCIKTTAQEDHVSHEQLREAMVLRLTAQLDDSRIANEIADFLMTDVLTWKADTLDITKSDSIIAFAFGNRLAINGNQTPGKMNTQLAELVVSLYESTKKPVYAQWEIAQIIGERIPDSMMFPIYPTVTNDGEIIYLSTEGVVLDIVRQAGGAEKVGEALVIAFGDHSLRAVKIARSLGINAYVPLGVELPTQYDPLSGQPWTRDRLTFVLYEIQTRAARRSRHSAADTSRH